MSVFSGIDKAEVYGSGANIRPGDHRFRVVELVTHRSRKKSGIVYFVAELEVLESVGGRPTSAKELPEGQKHPLSEAHRVGETVSWVVDMSQASALSNVKGFALALAPDASEGDITEETMLALINNDAKVGPVQPAAGIEIRGDAFMVLTGKGNDFTKIRWSAVG